ncbi:TetR family transcriptional regulator [Microbacterium faecale]|uniref:TetR family transcriptional regulator n=1 Tax=Microbacterium faecale TaxID=1804630 RepID=A0A917DCS4_9MICO|nr:TetR/AcrR family transcriptional regulator [Microbacterium faecale]GGD27308.1 TetR family transcriptional regulator [Microbacterium faecale]
MAEGSGATRRRLSKAERRAQLLDSARDLIRDAGTGEFTLARLADRAGVTKPLVYGHFGDRSGVFAELYREFEERQRETLAVALEQADQSLEKVAHLIADAYIVCSLAEGRELADVVAALTESDELSGVRLEAERAYLAMCRVALESHVGSVDTAALQAIVGAGEALARAALTDRIPEAAARVTLERVIIAVAAAPADSTAAG